MTWLQAAINAHPYLLKFPLPTFVSIMSKCIEEVNHCKADAESAQLEGQPAAAAAIAKGASGWLHTTQR